jgi:hypothetical protein
VSNTTSSTMYLVTIAIKNDPKPLVLEIAARGIRWSIEAAAKEMKSAWPYYTEGVDYTITEIKLVK